MSLGNRDVVDREEAQGPETAKNPGTSEVREPEYGEPQAAGEIQEATYTAENIGWTATNALRADLTLHCLRLDDSHCSEARCEEQERTTAWGSATLLCSPPL